MQTRKRTEKERNFLPRREPLSIIDSNSNKELILGIYPRGVKNHPQALRCEIRYLYFLSVFTMLCISRAGKSTV